MVHPGAREVEQHDAEAGAVPVRPRVVLDAAVDPVGECSRDDAARTAAECDAEARPVAVVDRLVHVPQRRRHLVIDRVVQQVRDVVVVVDALMAPVEHPRPTEVPEEDDLAPHLLQPRNAVFLVEQIAWIPSQVRVECFLEGSAVSVGVVFFLDPHEDRFGRVGAQEVPRRAQGVAEVGVLEEGAVVDREPVVEVAAADVEEADPGAELLREAHGLTLTRRPACRWVVVSQTDSVLHFEISQRI